jgi:hypothetical protein
MLTSCHIDVTFITMVPYHRHMPVLHSHDPADKHTDRWCAVPRASANVLHTALQQQPQQVPTGLAALAAAAAAVPSGIQPCCVTADAPLTLDATGRFKCVMGKCMCLLIGGVGEIVTQTWTSHLPTYAQDASVSFISGLKALDSVRTYVCTNVQDASLVSGRPLPAAVVIS